ncbi:MAG: aminotransferase class IV [Flavobacteriaceae bacterium]
MNEKIVLSTTESIRWENKRHLFFEDHYRSLLAKMRMKRMPIGMQFTPEWLLAQITDRIGQIGTTDSSVVDVQIQWTGRGDVAVQIFSEAPRLFEQTVIDLYRDYYITPGLAQFPLTDFTAINYLANVYGFENEYDVCLLMNTQKELVQTHLGSFFCVMDQEIVTPELNSGLLVNVWRTHAIKTFKEAGLRVVEKSMSLFDLQKADGVFILGPETGFLAVDQFRKTVFERSSCQPVWDIWNKLIQQ